MIRITRETKAVLNAKHGRVIGFTKSEEPGTISLAVPNDRTILTPTQARELAKWLVQSADETDQRVTRATWAEAERVHRDGIMRGLDGRP